MDALQQQIFNYLTEDGHNERKVALSEMVTKRVPDYNRGGSTGVKMFDVAAGEDSAFRLEAWLKYWEDKGAFCKDGIQRAKTALLGSRTVEVLVTLRLKVQPESTKANRVMLSRPNHTADYGLMDLIGDSLINAYGGNSEYKSTILDAQYIDYTINPK